MRPSFDVFAWVAYCARQRAYDKRAVEVMEEGVRYVESHYDHTWDRTMSELWDRARAILESRQRPTITQRMRSAGFKSRRPPSIPNDE